MSQSYSWTSRYSARFSGVPKSHLLEQYIGRKFNWKSVEKYLGWQVNFSSDLQVMLSLFLVSKI